MKNRGVQKQGVRNFLIRYVQNHTLGVIVSLPLQGNNFNLFFQMPVGKGLRATSPVHVHVDDDIPVHVHVKQPKKKKVYLAMP